MSSDSSIHVLFRKVRLKMGVSARFLGGTSGKMSVFLGLKQEIFQVVPEKLEKKFYTFFDPIRTPQI